MILLCLRLLYTFFLVGISGFGGGYAMLSMIMTESAKFGVTTAQMADLNALDMVVPGPIAINAATYVGYLSGSASAGFWGGFWGALFATAGVSLPSFLIVVLVMRFLKRYRENKLVAGFLSGVKPAAVGLIAAAAMAIAAGVLLNTGASLSTLFTNPMGTLSAPLVSIFVAVAVCNIRFRDNPILLTVAAGVIGAVFLG